MSMKERGKTPAKGAKPRIDWKALEIVHPDAAGIDIGGSEHWVVRSETNNLCAASIASRQIWSRWRIG